jgi:hypothetical protein
MATAAEMLIDGMQEEVWRKYCGFLDLSIDKFMEIQERLLQEQIDLLSKCELGRKFMGNYVPSSMADFRTHVPLSTHKDYLPYFLRNPHAEPGVLPAEPVAWVRTSGRSSEYGFKWAPYSQEMVRKVGEFVVTCFLLASCSERGEVCLEPGDVTLYTLAPAPYFTGGVIARGFEQELNPFFIPSLEAGDKMDFEQRIKAGFKLAGIHRRTVRSRLWHHLRFNGYAESPHHHPPVEGSGKKQATTPPHAAQRPVECEGHYRWWHGYIFLQ